MTSKDGKYRVAAIDPNDPKNEPKYIFDKFTNKADAVQKLNVARNHPDCKWTGVDPPRKIFTSKIR